MIHRMINTMKYAIYIVFLFSIVACHAQETLLIKAKTHRIPVQ